MKLKLSSLSERERKVITVALIGVLLILLYVIAVEPIYKWHQNNKEKYISKVELLKKYQKFVDQKEIIQKDLDQKTKLMAQIQQFLLPGNTPELAGAELQKIIKEYARQNNIEIKRITPKNFQKYKMFTAVSVSFPFRCHTSELKDFLYALLTDKRLLVLPEISIKATSARNPEFIEVDLTVVGFIERPEYYQTS